MYKLADFLRIVAPLAAAAFWMNVIAAQAQTAGGAPARRTTARSRPASAQSPKDSKTGPGKFAALGVQRRKTR